MADNKQRKVLELCVGRWLTPHREEQHTPRNVTPDLTICFSKTSVLNEVRLDNQGQTYIREIGSIQYYQ
jgi:hypothetical protein